MSVSPGAISPRRSAASSMASAIRSLLDPDGLQHSSLASTCTPRCGAKRASSIMGVSPISPTTSTGARQFRQPTAHPCRDGRCHRTSACRSALRADRATGLAAAGIAIRAAGNDAVLAHRRRDRLSPENVPRAVAALRPCPRTGPPPSLPPNAPGRPRDASRRSRRRRAYLPSTAPPGQPAHRVRRIADTRGPGETRARARAPGHASDRGHRPHSTMHSSRRAHRRRRASARCRALQAPGPRAASCPRPSAVSPSRNSAGGAGSAARASAIAAPTPDAHASRAGAGSTCAVVRSMRSGPTERMPSRTRTGMPGSQSRRTGPANWSVSGPSGDRGPVTSSQSEASVVT